MERQSKCLALEKKHVHDVYDSTAHHFKDVRYKAWPKVRAFLSDLEPASLVIDVGCGSGKYLHINKQLFKLGCDRSPALVDIARSRHHEVMACDNLHLPYRDNAFDAVISIGVIHHFTTKERRVQALRELARVLRPGGKLMVYVWAMEQNHRKFEAQDVLVPWHLQPNIKPKRKNVDASHKCQKQAAGDNENMNERDLQVRQNENITRFTPITKHKGLHHHSLGENIMQCQDRRRTYHQQKQRAITHGSTSSCNSPNISMDTTKDDPQLNTQKQELVQSSFKDWVSFIFTKPFAPKDTSSQENLSPKKLKSTSKLDEASFKEMLAQICKEDLERYYKHRPLLEHSISAPESEVFAVREFPQSSQPLKLRKIQSLETRPEKRWPKRCKEEPSYISESKAFNSIKNEREETEEKRKHRENTNDMPESRSISSFDKFNQILAAKIAKESERKYQTSNQTYQNDAAKHSHQSEKLSLEQTKEKNIIQRAHTIGHTQNIDTSGDDDSVNGGKVYRTVSAGDETVFSYELANAPQLFKKMKHKEKSTNKNNSSNNLEIKRTEKLKHEAFFSSSVSLSGDESPYKEVKVTNGLHSIDNSSIDSVSPEADGLEESSISSPEDISPQLTGEGNALTGLLQEVEGIQYPCLSDSDADEWAKVTVKAIRTMKTEVLRQVGSSMDSISSHQAVVGSSLDLEDVDEEEDVRSPRWAEPHRLAPVKLRKNPGGSETSSISSDPYTESDFDDGDSFNESPAFASPSPKDHQHFDFMLTSDRHSPNLPRGEGRTASRRKIFHRFVSMNENILRTDKTPPPPLNLEESPKRYPSNTLSVHRGIKKNKLISATTLPTSPLQDIQRTNPFQTDFVISSPEVEETPLEKEKSKNLSASLKKCPRDTSPIDRSPMYTKSDLKSPMLKERDENTQNRKGECNTSNDPTYQRYYHVFRQGELVTLVENQVDELHVLESYYDNANWCVIAEKVRVWKI